jgi:diguanylate cyclase (GGDEF)-like protein
MKRLPSLSPAARLAIGLVSLTVSLVLLADLYSGFLTDRLKEAQKLRTAAGQIIASEVATASQPEDSEFLQGQLAAAFQREPDLLSAAVQKDDGTMLASMGDHQRLWTLAPGEPSTLQNVRMPILTKKKPWGEVELAFRPLSQASPMAWIHNSLLQGFVLILLFGFVSFYLYVRRMLRYLDPNSAVPDHVRTAFDTLTEGVLVIDQAGNIMLANKAFRALHPENVDRLTGVNAGSVDWLRAGLSGDLKTLPWMAAIAENRQQLHHRLQIDVPLQGRRELVMNCSPIQDGEGHVRGCLSTFSDVTDLHERTERLRIAHDELAASQEEIRRKNEELIFLATRDALTGCLNRRALMTESEEHLAEALHNGTSLCCIMADIDHFKSINDRYGHGVGDQAIQAAAKAFERCLRTGDVLGRYGGEEFCVILSATSLQQALEIAERMRLEVEANAGKAIRDVPGVKMTCSFGVVKMEQAVATPMALINLADQALYHSKQNGRNRVTSWRDISHATAEAH